MPTIVPCDGCGCLIPPGEETSVSVDGKIVGYVHKGATRTSCRLRILDAIWNKDPNVTVSIRGVITFTPKEDKPSTAPAKAGTGRTVLDFCSARP